MSEDWPRRKRAIVRDGVGVGLAVGIYGISFGALAVASGFTTAQAATLSAVMFTGGSQFAFVGVLGAGGGAMAAGVAALLLGARNTLYGVSLATLLRPTPRQRALTAQLTIDESTAMALANEDAAEPRAARVAFWATGISVFVCWNIATVIGALGAAALGDPRVYGLDAIIPAAFLALLWPRLQTRQAIGVAVCAALVAAVLIEFVPAGLPVIAGAVVAAIWTLATPGGRAGGAGDGSPGAGGRDTGFGGNDGDRPPGATAEGPA